MTPAFIMTCPELGRDLSPITARVAHATAFHSAFIPERHEGLRMAYRGVAQLARRSGWPAVFLMEDDCQFTEHFSLDRWMEDAGWAFSHGYTLLNGGVFSAANPRPVRAGLVAVDRFKSSHCMVVHASAYGVLEQLVYPVDVSMGRLGAKCVVATPFVAVQGPVMSGHLGQFTDYRARYAESEASLLALGRAA